MAEQFVMTQKNLDDLKEELEYLVKTKRPEIIERIAEARSHGDLSENAEYDAARKAQAEMEGEIVEIENQIRNAKIIHAKVVTFLDVNKGKEDTYTIVGTAEADIAKKCISDESPIGKALLSGTVGQTVAVPLPNGSVKTIKILAKK